MADDTGASPSGDRAVALRVEPASSLAGFAAAIPSAEDTLLRCIAFNVAMIDPWGNAEHDQMLFDEAHAQATRWWKEYGQPATKEMDGDA